MFYNFVLKLYIFQLNGKVPEFMGDIYCASSIGPLSLCHTEIN